MEPLLFICAIIVAGYLLYVERQDRIIIYDTNENNVGEAQMIYFALKANRIRCTYSYTPNKDNFSFFFNKYKQGHLIIRVDKKYEDAARGVLLSYRILENQKKRVS